MKRDFSERARQELLGLVAQVEREKWSDFTDWAGDRWYDFQDWIGVLDIRNYINNVNDYHRKVLDKNNATEQSINAIFERVNSVDGIYRTGFDGIEEGLSAWTDKIKRLSDHILPGKGSFGGALTDASLRIFRWELEQENQELDQRWLYRIQDGEIILNEAVIEECLKDPAMMTNKDIQALRELATLLTQEVAVGHTVTCENPARLLEILSGTIDNINARAGDNAGVGLGKDVLGYLASLLMCVDSKGKPAEDVFCNILSLFENSAGVWIGMEKLLVEKVISVAEKGLQLHERFGKAVVGLGAAKYISAFIRGSINSYHVFVDENSSGYDKTAAGMELGGDALVMGGSIYAAGLGAQKGIQYVAGNGKIRNQILAVDKKVTVSNAVSSKISKVMSWVAIGDVALNFGAGGTRRYEEVTQDGDFDWGDAGSVGIHGAMGGLDTVANHLTLGLVDIDGEGFADELEESVDEFVRSDNWAAKVVRDEDTNFLIRGGVAFGAGAYIFVSETAESVGEGFNAAADWISSAWNGLFD